LSVSVCGAGTLRNLTTLALAALALARFNPDGDVRTTAFRVPGTAARRVKRQGPKTMYRLNPTLRTALKEILFFIPTLRFINLMLESNL
jgi:hypothetical protein